MFRNLLSRLLIDEPAAGMLAPGDADLAIAALLVRMARTDDRYSDHEQALIDRIFVQRHGLDMNEAADHRAAAEMIASEATDTTHLLQRIRNHVRPEDRRAVVDAMWQVVDRNGARDPDEEMLIRLAAGVISADDGDGAPDAGRSEASRPEAGRSEAGRPRPVVLPSAG